MGGFLVAMDCSRYPHGNVARNDRSAFHHVGLNSKDSLHDSRIHQHSSGVHHRTQSTVGCQPAFAPRVWTLFQKENKCRMLLMACYQSSRAMVALCAVLKTLRPNMVVLAITSNPRWG